MTEIVRSVTESVVRTETEDYAGASYADMREALLAAERFHDRVEDAMRQHLTGRIGQLVCMEFRPSSTGWRDAKVTFPSYSMTDRVRVPLREVVTIHAVSEETDNVSLGYGVFSEGKYDRTWRVKLRNILSIEPVDADSATE